MLLNHSVNLNFQSYCVIFGLTFSEKNQTDLSDVANYPSILDQTFIHQIVRMGPIQIIEPFPSTDGRSFSIFYYSKIMPNGESIKRDWILYSKTLDAVHCFCCRIFTPSTSVFSSINGFNDWQHLSRNIKMFSIF